MKKKICSILLVLALCLTLLPVTALAEGEGNEAKIGDVEYPTLYEAAAAAEDGDIIELLRDVVMPKDIARSRIRFTKPGTYTLLGHGHTITFERDESGSYTGRLSVAAGVTLNLGVDGDEEASALCMDGEGGWGTDNFLGVGGEGAVINMYEGVVLTNSINSGSAGIVQVGINGTFNMYGGEISNCVSVIMGAGGAVLVFGGTFNMTGGRIVNNRTVFPWGYGAGSGIVSQDGTVNLSNCEISGNMTVADDETYETPYPFGYGGGIYMIRGTLTAENCTIKDNLAKYGGGLFLDSAEATLTNCTISGNTAKEGGGMLTDGADVTLTGCDVVDNVSYDWGGGVYACGSTMKIDGGSITGNQAIFGGGLVNEAGTATVESGTVICNNTAEEPEASDSVEAAGDDVCNVSYDDAEASLTLPAVAEGLTLNPCGHVIDGWYDDGTEGLRWNVDDETLDVYAQIVEPATFTNDIALKAAHDDTPETPSEDDPDEPSEPFPPQLLLYLGGSVLNTDDHMAYVIGYKDGTVRPENSITRAEVATIFFRLLSDDYRDSIWSTENSFSDVNQGDWFNNAVSTLTSAGILRGYPDGTFHPNAPITRAEFAAIVARFSTVAALGKASFTDVPETHWAHDSIRLAEQLGWVGGYPDGTFKPERAITRAEAMRIVNRVLGRCADKDHLLPDMVTFRDNAPGAWYYADVQEATNSHSYAWQGGRYGVNSYENWACILQNPDWAELEKAWFAAR